MTTVDNALDPRIARSTDTVTGGIYSATVPGREAAKGELGKDAFLKLLVAQMKYQDPMNPADGTEFVAQTAQFTMVEKMVAMEEQNEKMLQSQQSLTASTFIGRDIQWITKDETTGKETTHTATVRGVRFSPDGPMLRTGDKPEDEVPLSVVQAVAPIIQAPPDEQAPPTDEDTGTDAADQTPTD